jgi:hypothetical protein
MGTREIRPAPQATFSRKGRRIRADSIQKLFGRSSTWVATWERIRFVEIGAT